MKVKGDHTQTMINKLLDHIEQSDKIPSLSSTLDIEMNHIPFHLRAQNGSAVLSFESWSNGLAFIKLMRKNDIVRRVSIRRLQLLLKKIDLTFYLQNKRFAIIGPRAGLIVPKLLTVASMLVKK